MEFLLSVVQIGFSLHTGVFGVAKGMAVWEVRLLGNVSRTKINDRRICSAATAVM